MVVPRCESHKARSSQSQKRTQDLIIKPIHPAGSTNMYKYPHTPPIFKLAAGLFMFIHTNIHHIALFLPAFLTNQKKLPLVGDEEIVDGRCVSLSGDLEKKRTYQAFLPVRKVEIQDAS